MSADYQLIIFDCDGTLVDSEALYNTAIADIVSEYGLTKYTPAYCLEHFTGLTLGNIRGMIEAESGHDLSSVLTSEIYVARAQAKMDEGLSAIPGARDLLDYAASRYKICVASNGERSSVIKSLKITGLFDYFGEERIFTKIEVPRPKPFPDLFLHAAAKMSESPAHTLVLEDSMAGVKAGVDAGMQVFGVTPAHHDPARQAENLRQIGAMRVFEALIHIPEALEIKKSVFCGQAAC